MSRRLLIGEESPEVVSLLSEAFDARGYDLHIVANGASLLNAAREATPGAILVSASLPDAQPGELVRQLRAIPRTGHVPIICLAPREQYGQALSVLEAGADDCVPKPLDVDELALRIENALSRAERENVVNPHSGLPGARLLEDRLQSLYDSDDDWTYLDLKIEHFEPFREANGFVAADQVLSRMPGLLTEVILAHGTERDYASHPADDHFVLVTFTDDPGALVAELVRRFNEDALTHYAFMDREMGYLTVWRGDEEVHVPLMTLTVTEIPPEKLFRQAED